MPHSLWDYKTEIQKSSGHTRADVHSDTKKGKQSFVFLMFFWFPHRGCTIVKPKFHLATMVKVVPENARKVSGQRETSKSTLTTKCAREYHIAYRRPSPKEEI